MALHTAASASPAEAAPQISSAGVAQARKKRSQVSRACDACRLHRTKCDLQQPCTSCRSRHSECSNGDKDGSSTLGQANREIGRLKKTIQDLQQQLQQERDRASIPTPQSSHCSPGNHSVSANLVDMDSTVWKHKGWDGVHIRTARSPHKTWYGPSSLFYFIKRFTSFINVTLQETLSADHMLPNSASKLFLAPTGEPGEAPDPGQPESGVHVIAGGRRLDNSELKNGSLSPAQEEYFLNLYWQSCHTSLLPILDEAEFKEHYRSLWTHSGKERSPSALVDIVLAMCMQYGISMLPISQQGVASDGGGGDATMAGRWHYRRSHTQLAYELESPTVSTLQCHLLSAIYLCCGSFQNMADSACALAVRVAYMLGLHLDPPQQMALRERESRKRLWWALNVLDSKIGMKLGRPFLLRDSPAAPELLSDTPEAARLSGSGFAVLEGEVTWLSFHLHNTKLFSLVRAAHTAFYDQGLLVSNSPTQWNDLPTVETYADILSSHTKALEEWTRNVPDALKMKRQGDALAFSVDQTTLQIEQFAPLWIQRQRLLLELMYHNLSINIRRPFISFTPSVSLSTFHSSRSIAETIAIKCVAHAMALTNITHQVLSSSSSILDGWHEAFQWQWNAAMTIVGFVLAYPQSESALSARRAMDVAIAVFDIFGKNFIVATSAAGIIRDLSVKVDFLIRYSQQLQNVGAPIGLPTDEVPTDNFNVQAGNQSMFGMNNGAGMMDGIHQDASASVSFDDFNAISNQDLFDMALSIDLWGDLDTLWPSMDGSMPPVNTTSSESYPSSAVT